MHKGQQPGCDDAFPGGITNGAEWYNVQGEIMQYYYAILYSAYSRGLDCKS